MRERERERGGGGGGGGGGCRNVVNRCLEFNWVCAGVGAESRGTSLCGTPPPPINK